MKGPPVISTKQYMGSTLLKKYNDLEENPLHYGEGGEGREKTPWIKSQEKEFFHQQLWQWKRTLCFIETFYDMLILHKHFKAKHTLNHFCLNVFTVEHLDWFAAGSDRLSVPPLSPFSQISFHRNRFFRQHQYFAKKKKIKKSIPETC